MTEREWNNLYAFFSEALNLPQEDQLVLDLWTPLNVKGQAPKEPSKATPDGSGEPTQ